jgi:hypothetical protein
MRDHQLDTVLVLLEHSNTVCSLDKPRLIRCRTWLLW